MKRTSQYIQAIILIFGFITMAEHAQCEDLIFKAEELTFPGKRGVSKWDHSDAARKTQYPIMEQLKPYWTYSWGTDLYPQRAEYLSCEFVPMIWSDYFIKDLEKVAELKKRGKVKRLLGFNEPDGKGQADMTPEEALDHWPKLEAMQLPLCSPSAIHADRDWMRTFMKGVQERGYRVDYIGVHWYGGTNPGSFKKHLKSIHELWGRRPIIVTEFSPADWNTEGDLRKNRYTPAAVLAFAKDVLPWLEEQDWIAGYCWYSWGIHESNGYTSALHDHEGSLTQLGKYYASITTENPKGDQSIKPDNTEQFQAKAILATAEYEKSRLPKK